MNEYKYIVISEEDLTDDLGQAVRARRYSLNELRDLYADAELDARKLKAKSKSAGWELYIKA